MTVAIHTRYIPSTDKKQSRVKAFANRGRADGRDVIFSITIPYDWTGHEHLHAAEALRDKHWPGEPLTFCGLAADGRGDVYTLSQECASTVAAAPDLLAVLQVIHANAAESPEWIRARTAPAIARATGADA